MKQLQIVKKFPLAIAAGLLLLPMGCSPKVDTGGYIQDGDIKSKITVGQTSKNDVMNALGSPSSLSSFGDESWYYITDRKESYAFLTPEIVEQDVVRIEFNKAGIVSKIESYDKNSADDIAIAQRSTPTEGHTLGFFEQMLGNLGRFNKPGGEDSAAPGRQAGHGY